MVIRKHVTIDAAPDLIWDVITDLGRAKEWAPGFEDYPHISADWPRTGGTATWRYHAGMAKFDFQLAITKGERGRLLQISGSGSV